MFGLSICKEQSTNDDVWVRKVYAQLEKYIWKEQPGRVLLLFAKK